MRLELTSKTDLAVRALRMLVEVGGAEPVKGPALAAALGSTVYYLPQVMRPLVEMGWVLSASGPNGGYRLAPSPDGISVRQVVEAVEGPIVDGRCVLRHSACPVVEPCALHYAWSRARSAMADELGDAVIVEPFRTDTEKGKAP
jgi:Rrf2 family protein